MDRRFAKRIARYWAKMECRNLKHLASLDVHSWFDLWHTHPDWQAKGNKCIETRKDAAKSGYRLLIEAEKLLAVRTKPFQCFATVCEDTRDNGVYIHTENPNSTPYPHGFDGVVWESTECDFLNDMVDLESHRIGKVVYSSETCFIITSR